MDSDPANFVLDLQDASKKLFLQFFSLLHFESAFTLFFKIKSQKEVTKQ
jgi:hypothetical protein